MSSFPDLTEHRPGNHRWVYVGIAILLLIDFLNSGNLSNPSEWMLIGVMVSIPLIQALRPNIFMWAIIFFPWSLWSSMVVGWYMWVVEIEIPDSLTGRDVLYIYYTVMPVVLMTLGFPRKRKELLPEAI